VALFFLSTTSEKPSLQSQVSLQINVVFIFFLLLPLSVTSSIFVATYKGPKLKNYEFAIRKDASTRYLSERLGIHQIKLSVVTETIQCSEHSRSTNHESSNSDVGRLSFNMTLPHDDTVNTAAHTNGTKPIAHNPPGKDMEDND